MNIGAINLSTLLGKRRNTAAPTAPSISVAELIFSPPKARLIRKSAVINDSAVAIFPSGENSPAISPPNEYPPQIKPCSNCARLNTAPVEAPLTAPPLTPPFFAQNITAMTAIILPSDTLSIAT